MDEINWMARQWLLSWMIEINWIAKQENNYCHGWLKLIE